MPLMTQIRENLTTFFSVFAGLFVVYIVLDWGMDITGRRDRSRSMEAQEIGKVNGDVILAKDFMEIVRQASDNQKQQTGTEPDDNQSRAIREQVWNELVEQKLFEEEIKRLGITVPDIEVLDVLTGENPPEFLRRQFTDSTGTFLRANYDQAIRDRRNNVLMVKVEDAVRKQREREKLQSIVLASVQVPEGDILQRFIDQNMKFEGDELFFDINQLVTDEEVKATDDDIRRYYNEHADEFKVEATRKLKYVVFNDVASKSDTEGVISDLEDIARRAKEGVDFLELAKTYSEVPLSDVFFKHGELGPDREVPVFAAKVGDVLPIIKTFDGYHLTKVLEFREGKEEYINASHILVQINNNDTVAALKSAREIAAKARAGQDFAKLAADYSKDASNAQKGGELGWFGKGRMVKEFEDAAFKANTGQIVGPVKTSFGYHIIKVVAKDKREARIVDIRMKVQTSLATRNELSQKAEDFAYLAKQGDFVNEATQSKYTVQETPPFQKNGAIAGIGIHQAINKFAFNSKVGTVSDVYTIPTGYGIYMVSEVKEAGTKPFEEVRAGLEGRVRRERKLAKGKELVAQLRSSVSPSDGLEKIQAMRKDATLGHLPSFTLGAGVPVIGRDLAVMGAISNLPVGEISKPVEGTRGIYLIKLTSRSAFDTAAYNAQKDLIRTQLMSDRRTRFLAEWTDHLKKSADIVDNRDMFYR